MGTEGNRSPLKEKQEGESIGDHQCPPHPLQVPGMHPEHGKDRDAEGGGKERRRVAREKTR
jgi:hypothetical protein